MAKITHAEIRMYRMGTGDCFIIKLFAGQKESFKMMIDCGTWQGTKERLAPYIQDLKAYVNNEVDLLVVTHEHKDHVYGFEACDELFKQGFIIRKIWMGWTENDKIKKVASWKKDYGEKKKALALAADKLKTALESPEYKAQFTSEHNGLAMFGARQSFSRVLAGLTELQLSAKGGEYKGMLEGMRVVKEELAEDNIQYFRPGDIIENVENAPGVRFYVLGPPLLWDNVKAEAGGQGETYQHNKELADSDAFSAAVLNYAAGQPPASMLPFDEQYVLTDLNSPVPKEYENSGSAWRKIDFEWLYSAGSLALRINSLTNNLSLALAIEFTDSGRVLLFPGDAEYGSWASWHTIKWPKKGLDGKKHLTEDLLNRTVFYKVAHHLSHNGTAQRLGLQMMTHADLAAMATLDYGIISDGWKSTMPNRALLKDLLNQTKGRLMIMSDKDLFFDLLDETPLRKKIDEARSKMSTQESKRFKDSFAEEPLYLQYTVNA
jgi:hypothetical protein